MNFHILIINNDYIRFKVEKSEQITSILKY